jgi:glutaredoxin-like protein
MTCSNSDLTKSLSALQSPVRLLFFEQSIGCDSCRPTRQLLQQLADLSPYLSLETMNLVLERGRAEEYGIDRVPAIVISSPRRERIRFYGAPLGYELASLVEAISMTASGDSGLRQNTREWLETLVGPVRLQVFFTPNCVYCPEMVTLANRFAVAHPLISATAVDATEYPDLVRRYNVNGVPKTIINDRVEFVGAASEEDLVRHMSG